MVKERIIKCVVWDLDNTLWEGVLLEDEQVQLDAGIHTIIQQLDERGILQSIASRNDEATALAKLTEFGLADYFLYPQINWNAKSNSLQTIAEQINIGFDAIAFIDDQPFEREEVAHQLPQVFCLDVLAIPHLLEMPQFIPRFITEDSRQRRAMYQSDLQRKTAEKAFVGPTEAFLANLNMKFTIAPASENDLRRAEELTVRTNQLNTTGYSYDYDELNSFRQADNHLLLITSLQDKYGSLWAN